MEKEHALQLIGVAIFLIATTLTYGIVTPVNNATSHSLEKVTDKITNATVNTTNATNPTDDTARIANNYHILTAIAVGAVLAIVIVFLIGFW